MSGSGGQGRARGFGTDMLLECYARGIFPMAEHKDDPEIFWVDPRRRGVFPLDRFHISRSLARRLRRGDYRIAVDEDFAGVLDGCADRAETWISTEIRRLYLALFARGNAHSLEVHDTESDALVGGVYGVTLGGAFFGESMFSRRTDASKIALAFLVDRLRQGGFTLFDTQFVTDHLRTLGAVEIPRLTYRARLAEALRRAADFDRAGRLPTAQELLQRSTQRS